MHVTQQENEKYRQFVSDVAQRLGVFDFNGEQIVWHYTDGAGLLGILQSATIYATQVASLNDANETKYATDLYKQAVKELITESAGDEEAVAFLTGVLEFVKEEPDSPTHGTSKFFVTCFSADEDELTQWDQLRQGQWLCNRFPRSRSGPRADEPALSGDIRQRQTTTWGKGDRGCHLAFLS